MKKWTIPVTTIVAVSFFLVPRAYGGDESHYRAQGVAIGFASALVLDHLLDDHKHGSSAVHVDYRYGDGGYGRGYSDLSIGYGYRDGYRDRYRHGDRYDYKHRKKHKRQKAKAYWKGYRRGYREGFAYGPPGPRYRAYYRNDYRWERHDRHCRCCR